MEENEKLVKLYAMAEEDEINLVWKKSYEEFSGAFRVFVGEQPKDIRNFLWGYAETGRLMMQRMTNIACEKMEFVEDVEDGCKERLVVYP